MKTSKIFNITKEVLFLSSIVFFAILSIILGLVNTKTEDFDEAEKSLKEHRESVQTVGIIEMVINSILLIYIIFIAIKHNKDKSNGGINVDD